jgi:hypothetical protein
MDSVRSLGSSLLILSGLRLKVAVLTYITVAVRQAAESKRVIDMAFWVTSIVAHSGPITGFRAL